MSAPVRVQVEADEVATAEAVCADQPTEQPTAADSALTMETPRPTPAGSEPTMETPRTVFRDLPGQLSAQHVEEDPETGEEIEITLVGNPDRHAPDESRVVRKLKEPPEIWDLVHETPANFNPGGAFVARLTSSQTNLILLLLGVIFISGISVFAVITLRDGQKRGGAAAQVKEERGTSQTAPTSQVGAPASAPNAPVLNTSPSAESVVDNTPPQLTVPPPTDPQPTASKPTAYQLNDPQLTTPPPTVPSPDNAAFAGQPLTDNIQPTGGSVNISKRTASRAGRGAWSRNKRSTVASGWRNADKSADKPADNPGPARRANAAAGRDASAKPHTPQPPETVDLKRSYEKSSSDSASAKKTSKTTLSPQLIAPPTTSSAPKAKVIQWP